MREELIIRLIRPEEQEAARVLILEGMREHWGFIDPNMNPDLNAIMEYYPDTFFVGMIADELVATGALVALDVDTYQIVRMSVNKARRRLGIGREILRVLIQRAEDLGARLIILETNTDWVEARAFYESAGFSFTHEVDGEAYYEMKV